MHRRMPVVASVKRGRQFPGRCDIRIAIQSVANVVWILLVYAGEGKIGKPLRSVDVERNRVLGRGSHGEQKEGSAKDEFHRS